MPIDECRYGQDNYGDPNKVYGEITTAADLATLITYDTDFIPRNPRAVTNGTESELNLSWLEPISGIYVSGYRIYKANTQHIDQFAPIGCTTGLTFTDSGLNSRDPYYYRIVSVY